MVTDLSQSGEAWAAASRTALRRTFWIAVAILAVVIGLSGTPQYAESAIGAAVVIAASLLPIGLWVYGRVGGWPIFPVFAFTHLWTFGLPLLYEHPVVMMFSAANQLVGAATVAGFLLLGTAIWFAVARRPSRPKERCLLLRTEGADMLFLLAIGGGAALTILLTANWIAIPADASSIVRAIVLALQALACFVLSYRMGRGELGPSRSIAFKLLLLLLLLSTLPGLLLVNALSVVGVAIFGFTLGARRFVWRWAIIVMAVFAFLHAGKGEMRNKYWNQDEDFALQPAGYPGFLAEWVTTSATHLFSPTVREEEAGQSFLERASLMQLLLYVQRMTPEEVPYIGGDTYAIIPSLLLPRFLNTEKVASHEGTYLLNIHYGFQTREDTQRTTIGFGLLNEAFANFGYFGVVGLAVLMGAYYGLIGKWAQAAPILSLRALFAVLVASYSFQTEFAAGVYVAALFQSTCALLLVAVIFMRPTNVGVARPATGMAGAVP